MKITKQIGYNKHKHVTNWIPNRHWNTN